MNIEELAKQVQVLEDIEEIKKLQAHYVNCLLLTNFEDMFDCFSKDGVLDLHAGRAVGKKEMRKLFDERLKYSHIGQEGEFAVHPIITVDGDKAKGSWLHYIQFAQPRKLEHRPGLLEREYAPDWLQGYYEAEYVRENGKWKISFLKWRCRLMSPMEETKQD
jgi:hypothetical protein